MLNLLTTLLLTAATFAASGKTEFFVFDNGVGRGSWTPEKQAKTVKAIGYDGISYNYTKPEDLAAWQKACGAEGLKIFGLYVFGYVDQPEPFPPGIREAIKLLKGTDTIVWLAIRAPKTKGDYDQKAVEITRDLADLAADQGVRVALYGHAGFYVETGTDSARIAKLVGRKNVSASLNLCHEFLSKQQDKLDETIKTAAPVSSLASINGVDVAGAKYIVRLDQGDFDVAAYVRKMHDAGYRGPIGLQCFNVPGDIEANLKANFAAWQRMQARLQAK